jgi:hypothetical protein
MPDDQPGPRETSRLTEGTLVKVQGGIVMDSYLGHADVMFPAFQNLTLRIPVGLLEVDE